MGKFIFNEKLLKFTPYEPICGEYRIRMDANESFISQDAETAGKIAAKIAAAQLNRYPDPYAAGVCAMFADYCGLQVENVVAGNGSDELISILLASFFNKGDKIMLFTPEFSMYGFYAQISELETVIVPKDDDMLIDIDTVCDRINKESIKGVFLSNPCNPTSVGIRSGDIIKLAERTSALVVIDEAYMEFYGDSVIGKLTSLDNLVVLKTCSKAFGLAGIRLGFALSNKSIVDAIKTAKSPYNVSLITQLTAEAVLSDIEKIKRDIDKIIISRDYLYNEINNIAPKSDFITRVYPTCTNFVFIKTAEGRRIFEGMKRNGIVIRFMGDCLRITAGSEYENSEFLKALAEM